MAGLEYGGGLTIKTTGDGMNHRLSEVPTSAVNVSGASPLLDKQHFEAKFVLFVADSGNSASVKVGPNGLPTIPIGPTQQPSAPLWFADPSECAFNDGGNAGQLLYVVWGAASERWFAAQAMKKAKAASKVPKATTASLDP